MRPSSALWGLLQTLLQLALLGLAVGAACWPLNLMDRLQAQWLGRLPAFSGQGWTAPGLLLAASPLVVLPLLLGLQADRWHEGAGSGIPQTMACLENSADAEGLMAPRPTLQRLALWSAATLALMPLGREGPVVHVGAAVAHGLRRRWPGLLKDLQVPDLLAIGAGAGLAGGFNTPLMGVVFMAEELTHRFQLTVILPALLVCSSAAAFSHLGGEPMFGLGLLSSPAFESDQLAWALPVGVLGGLLGAGFSRLLLETSRLLLPHLRRRPLRLGLLLGGLLAALALLSGGSSGGDGETLMSQLIEAAGEPFTPLGWMGLLLARLVGPVLALGGGIPGGLIDPAFSLGAVFGDGLLRLFGADPHLGLALGMAAGLAGATQLPVMTIVFAVRLAGDQQLLPGLLLAATLGAYTGRLVLDQPIYHALAELQRAPRR
ncbi:chloride channel protein [Cyanobium sp. Morenito 9A2]|uniref:chloride channel protein n=1 Tax=Cyanobium sp. Morenito 9A2 TaxID=2823718 RepID=UPI0020CFB37A|nr:chloride channel protein [Cyanobium sp. Morenito 9A2]